MSPRPLLALGLVACAHAPRPPAVPRETTLTVEVPAASATAASDHLACTFTAPGTARPAPAVLLIKGTGPQDRDGNNRVEHHGLHGALARRLAERGVASLRCDARGYGGSSGWFWDATFATYVRDAHALLAALRRLDGVDARRIGIVGHSEGGIVGPVVADEDAGVRALVLIGAGASPFLDSVLWQTRDELRREHAAPETIEAAVQLRRTVLTALAAGEELPAMLPASVRDDVAPMVPWLRSRLAHDTRAHNRALRHLPILIVQGEHDLATPPADAELLRADLAAGHNADARLVRLPDLDHFLVRVAVDEEPAAGSPDAAAVDLVAAFVAGAI